MTANERTMRKLIAQLPLPDTWDMSLLVESVAQTRNRPITLVPLHSPSLTQGFCGLWLQRRDDDLLLYDGTTSKYHADQIIAHEIGHMILGHGDCEKPENIAVPKERIRLAEIFPDINPEIVQKVLGRGNFGASQEHEAELFASLIMVAQAERELNKPTMRNTLFGSR